MFRRGDPMLVYALIGLSLTLAGVAGLQLTYMFYLDRLDRERKQRLGELERTCRNLTARLEAAEKYIAEQEEIIGTLEATHLADENWADVIDER